MQILNTQSLNEKIIIKEMSDAKDKWNAVANFCNKVIAKKEEDERARDKENKKKLIEEKRNEKRNAKKQLKETMKQNKHKKDEQQKRGQKRSRDKVAGPN